MIGRIIIVFLISFAVGVFVDTGFFSLWEGVFIAFICAIITVSIIETIANIVNISINDKRRW